MMVDTHTHIFGEEFAEDRDAVVERAKASGIGAAILPNIDKGSIGALCQTMADYEGWAFGAMGLHPSEVTEAYKADLEVIEAEWAAHGREYVAVGEVGMDLYWDDSRKKEQAEALRVQAEWAVARGLPLILHVRKALDETLDVLNPLRGRGLRGVFHCFEGTEEMARRMLGMGDFVLGIGGAVTFKKCTWGDVVKKIGVAHLVVETDAPYLSPVPHRGKRNEPAYIRHTLEKVAALTGLSPEKAAAATTENAWRMFDLGGKGKMNERKRIMG